jgi:hypothetical protein
MRITALVAPFIPGESPPLVIMAIRRRFPDSAGGGCRGVMIEGSRYTAIKEYIRETIRDEVQERNGERRGPEECRIP